MASTDARPIPQKNVAFRVTLPIFDADGDLVTGATGLDSEISKDGAGFADCTNEATEIGSTGIYTLDLTNTEMNADTVAIIVKTTSSGAKTTPIIMYPEEAGDIRVNVTQYGGSNGTFSGGRPEVNTTHVGGTSQTAGDLKASLNTIDDFVDSEIADIQARLPAALTANGNIKADTLRVGGTVQTAGDLSAQIDAVDNFIDTEVAAILAAVDTEVGDIKAKTDNLPSDPADASVVAGLIAAVETKVDTIDDFLDTEIAAIKLKTDLINIIRGNTAQAGAGGTITLDASASAVDDFYNFTIISIISGTGVGQARIISDYVGATKVASVNGNWATNPDNTSVFQILAFGVIPGASAPSAADIRAEIDANSTKLDVAVSTRASQASLNTLDDFVDTEVADIKAKTDNLPSDPADASVVAGLIAGVDAKIDTIDNFLDTEIGDIKAKTDNLPSDPADASVVAGLIAGVDAKIDVIDDFLDTEILAIKAKTDLLPDGITKNVSIDDFTFFMTDSADHISPKTGLTVTAERSIDGGAFAACTNAPTEISSGVYKIDLSAGDLNGDVITLKFTSAGADQTTITIKTQT